MTDLRELLRKCRVYIADEPANWDEFGKNNLLFRLDAALARSPNQPKQGMVMVPREPTKAMLDAGYEAAAFPRDPEICVAMYKAMLAAAPKAGEG